MNERIGTDDAFSFARRLREERQRLGLTQSAFASAGGVAKPTVIGYERGLRKPDIEFLARLVDLGVDTQFLITGKRSSAIDWPLIDAVYTGIERACLTLDLRVKTGKRSELARVLYEHFVAEHRVDSEVLLRIVNLAAA